MFRTLKRKAAVLAVLVVACIGGMSVVGAVSASAASCQYNIDRTYWNGQFTQDVHAFNCTHVNGIRFYGYDSSVLSGMETPNNHRFYVTSTISYTLTGQTFPDYYITFSVPQYTAGCNGPNPLVYSVPQARLQIRNDVGNTWGTIFSLRGADRYLC